jgi:hypothetical protein
MSEKTLKITELFTDPSVNIKLRKFQADSLSVFKDELAGKFAGEI